jgi:lactate racemase
MKIDMRYGRGVLPLTLPDDADVTVVRKPVMPLLADTEAAVATALDQPVGTPPLDEIARNANTACIAICDITRPVPNHLFLRPMIERLLAAGVPRDGITVLVATGLHRPNEGDELAELIGDPWVLDNVRVENHFARDDAAHVDLGRTETRGTVVRIDRRFVEADIRIATGLVEPHFMAGYSGGRKVIAPGLAHAETITTFHSSRFMADPAAVNCNFAGNPLHEEQLEIVKLVGGALALNTIIDEDRNLSFVNFGEILASHLQSVDFVREFCEVAIPRQFSTVVTSAAGYPLDKTYYQTVKGMVGAMDILAPGGELIIASECSEGMGSPEFAESQRRLVELGPKAFLQSILKKSHASIDEWQTQMQLKPMAIGSIALCTTGLKPEDHSLTGVRVVHSLDEAVAESISRGDGSIAVIPEGPYVVPFFREPVPATT